MLEKLCKKQRKWESMAFKLCGNKEDAKDLVQDMYIKAYEEFNSNKDIEIKDVYCWILMHSIFIDKKRKESLTTFVELDEILNLAEENKDFDLDDQELLFLNRAKEFRYLSRGLLELNYDLGLRAIEKETSINYGYIFRTLEKVRKLILRDDYEKLYKNRRLKYQK